MSKQSVRLAISLSGCDSTRRRHFHPPTRLPVRLLHASVTSSLLQTGFQLLQNSLPLSLSITLLSASPLFLTGHRCACVILILCRLIEMLRTSNVVETISANTGVSFSFYLHLRLSHLLHSSSLLACRAAFLRSRALIEKV